MTIPLKNRTIAGLDIGTTKVCAVVAEIQDSDLHQAVITGAGMCLCEGVQKGAVVDVDATIQAVEQAVDQAGRQAGCEVESVYLGVTGAHIASLTSTGHVSITNTKREIGPREVDQVIAASRIIVLPPDRQIIHSIPRSFSIDGQAEVIQPVGMHGERLEVHTYIVHGATAQLRNLEKCVTGAGLDIAATVLQPIATAEAVLLPAEKESGVCLLDIGGSTSNLAVFVSGEIFHSAVIPVGGNHVTNDIVYGLTVGRDEAERLKIENGCALAELVPQDDVVSVHQVGRNTARKLRRRALVQIIEPRMQELLQLVMEELSLAYCLDKMPSGIVITGGGSLLTGCMEMVHEVMEMPVRLGAAYGVGGLSNSLKHPVYATAIGLAQYGALHYVPERVPLPSQDPVRSVWNQLVRSIKRSVAPR